MNITELVWNLFILLLPGVISTLMIRYISTNRKYSVFDFVIYSAILGVGTFVIMELFCSLYWLLLGIFYESINIEFGLNLSVWENLFNGHNELNKTEMFISYLLAVPLGFLWGFIISKKVIIRVFQNLKLTTRYGDDDVWCYFLNSPDNEWIYVHNKVSNLTYYGKISAYSDSTEKRELILEDVVIYQSDTWQEKYETNAVYLELNSYEFTMESPKLIENGKDNNNQE